LFSALLLRGWLIFPLSAQPTVPSILMDGHVHITNRVYWEGIDPWQRQPIGPWDYSRAWDSGLNVAIENIGTYGYTNYNGTVKQALRLIEAFHKVLETHQDRMEMAVDSAGVRRIVNSGKMAVILGIEAGFDNEGDVSVLDAMYRLGVRSIQFSGHETTAYADANRGPARWNGINAQGRRLIREMNRLGIIIDISHASEAAQLAIIDASSAPVVASHTAMRQLCPNPANLSDNTSKRLAAKGGLVGIQGAAEVLSARYYEWSKNHPEPPNETGWTLADLTRFLPDLIRSPNLDFGSYEEQLDWTTGQRWREFYSRPWHERAEAEPLLPTVDDWAAHVAHVIALVGPKHVAIGLDLVHGRGALRDFDASQYEKLPRALSARGISAGAIRQIMGENWLRILEAARTPAVKAGSDK